jgi:predicted P-loop ATPase
VISVGYPRGNGTGLGKVEQKTFTLKKLREKFAEPLVDVNTPISKYLKLKKVASDTANSNHKAANDQIQAMKISAGNWTAARYEGKSRKVSDIAAKTMLVLDIDHANPDQVMDLRANLTPIAEFYWLAHTSRSHVPEKPKFRLAFPVSREMSQDEAHACLRHLSTYLLDDPEESIEIVDIVTFRPNQTMFWPSISKGQDFWWDENLSGEILDVDEFLGRHPGWEDFTTLPYQQGEKKQGLRDPGLKMENPLEKPEPIGAFCRTYSIEDAIDTFLPDIYERSPNASDIRYNFTTGTANNGAVVYDDGLFLNSMHSSDPAAGLHNAFDLVRLHLFGHLDEDAHGNTAPGNLPSYKAMVKMCREDKAVVTEEFTSRGAFLDDLDDEDEDDDEGHMDPESRSDDPLGDQLDDLDDEDEGDPEVEALLGEGPPKAKPKKKQPKEESDGAWLSLLLRKQNGDVDPASSYNATTICRHHPALKGKIGFNEFTEDPICLSPIQWKRVGLPQPTVTRRVGKSGQKWAEENDQAIKLLCSAPLTVGGLEANFSKESIQTAVVAAAGQNRVHPVKEMIQDWHETWKANGSKRGELERVAIDYLGCPDTIYHRESIAIFLVGAVARIFEPGCKMDVMAVIQGATGCRKSTFWHKLFNGYCTELKVELKDSGRLIESLRGWWCLEMAEMVQARRADSETLKAELSSGGDQHRLAYARRETFWHRRNVFTGTVNTKDFLSDPTSVRRFFVYETPKSRKDPINTEKLEERLWAIWGEAYQVYLDMRAEKPHGDLWLDLKSDEAIAEQTKIAEGNRKQTVAEEIADAIQEWVDTTVPADLAMVDESNLTLDGYEGDESPMVRNMVTAQMAFEALADTPIFRRFRNVRTSHFGHALEKLPGWTRLGKVRRHRAGPAVWFYRDEDGPLWVPAPKDDEDDLLS